jgi:hypothetical protein
MPRIYRDPKYPPKDATQYRYCWTRTRWIRHNTSCGIPGKPDDYECVSCRRDRLDEEREREWNAAPVGPDQI